MLTGCGGGGVENTTSPASGIYAGNTADGAVFNAVILLDNTMWAIYAQQLADGSLRLLGAFTGAGKVTGSTYTTADAKGIFYNPANPAATALSSSTGAELAASFVPGTSISGTVRAPRVASLGYSGAVPAASQYVYLQPAQLQSVVGRWDGAAINQEAAFLNVRADGSFTGAIGLCTYAGKFEADPRGINAFTSTLTLGAAPCAAPGLNLAGIAFSYKNTNGKTALVIAGLTADRATGTAFYAQR